MITQPQFIGIDVSKDRLDIHVHPEGSAFSLPNSKAGLASLARKLKSPGVQAIGLEASGGYERTPADTLAAAGFTVHVIDPAQVRAFARAMKTRAKTDALDAMMIARYLEAARDSLIAHEPDAARRAISELAAWRRKLTEEAKGLKAHLATLCEPVVRRMVAKRLDTITREIHQAQDAIKARIAADPKLSERASRLQSLPGVGPVLTATLIADLKELGTINAKRIASLTGIAPHARQSGKTARPGRCGGGRKPVRDVLYMATLSAIKARMPHLHPFYTRLRAAGKPFKVALIAAMRKFLTIINAIIRDNTAFRPKHPTSSTVA